MECFNIGDRVCEKKCFEGDECHFQGKVIGHGWANGNPMILVRLSEGGYIENEHTKMYVSAIIVHPDNLELC